LPFRIRPGAPSSSIDIAAGGSIGFGTASPTASMHLKRTDGTAVLKVEETSVTKTNRQVLQLVNNGGAQFSFNNGVNEWRAGTDNAGTVRIDVLDGAGDIEFRLDTDGNLEIAGTLTENSDVNAKHDIQQTDAAAILASVLGLQVSEWSYNGETVRHIGPMAQDFAAAFGLGAKTTSIATRDIAGVALLSIQALAAENAELKARVDSLEQRLAELEAKVDAG
ncbi:MAG: tail fiber domain-containing protein, partial [Actinobacteria bacterium]|nr:tail fiber domain-containing protein [Actinomycetota bacterium]